MVEGLFLETVGFSKGSEHEVQLFPIGTTIRTRTKDKWNMRNVIKVTHSSTVLVKSKVIHGPPPNTQAF